jgi:hypothetical protein
VRCLAMLVLIGTGFLSGCDDMQLADKSKEVVISKSEYEQLRAAAAETKQVGRYQLHREGMRTWRLDTATGRSCLLLTSETDWKGEGGQERSCSTEDWTVAQERHKLYPSLYDSNGQIIPQK